MPAIAFFTPLSPKTDTRSFLFELFNLDETIKTHIFLSLQAVKLESIVSARCRYMTVVSTVGRQDTEESVILGIDIQEDKASMGLVLPIWGDMSMKLDGDG